MVLKHFFFPVKLTYDGKKEIGPSSYSFNFILNSPLKWKAGQYGLLQIKMLSGKYGIKPFSIASAPGEGLITIATKISKDTPDDFKRALLGLKRGTPARLRGPIGRSYIKDYSKPYAMLTTGIGITPFRSILKQLVLDGQLDTKITLFFVGNKESHYFKEEIGDIKTILRNFSVEYIYKPDRITGQTIEDALGKSLFETTYFLSGSPNLVRGYRRTLMGLGVQASNIKSSKFFGYKTPQKQLKSILNKDAS